MLADCARLRLGIVIKNTSAAWCQAAGLSTTNLSRNVCNSTNKLIKLLGIPYVLSSTERRRRPCAHLNIYRKYVGENSDSHRLQGFSLAHSQCSRRTSTKCTLLVPARERQTVSGWCKNSQRKCNYFVACRWTCDNKHINKLSAVRASGKVAVTQ